MNTAFQNAFAFLQNTCTRALDGSSLLGLSWHGTGVPSNPACCPFCSLPCLSALPAPLSVYVSLWLVSWRPFSQAQEATMALTFMRHPPTQVSFGPHFCWDTLSRVLIRREGRAGNCLCICGLWAGTYW